MPENLKGNPMTKLKSEHIVPENITAAAEGPDKEYTHEALMQKAVLLASENIDAGGGPFGAVIARKGKIIATGVNRVTANGDPTAHAEVMAIREACRITGSWNLAGCDIYSSCEPCPMCLGAIYWAHLDHLYYGATKQDAAAAGFDDAFIYKELAVPPASRRLITRQIADKEAVEVFRRWIDTTNKTVY